LTVLFELYSPLKVSKKSKEYNQEFVRTMFFLKWERNPEVEIDGNIYNVSAQANVANYDCRNALFDISNLFQAVTLEDSCTPEGYLGWKKELQKFLKDWEKNYVKHQKSKIYDEMKAIHTAGMKPLMELIHANLDFSRIQKMSEKDKEGVPNFRFIALEEEFVRAFTFVCDIFKLYGDDKIEEHYDIRQMLETLKIKNWRNCIPFRCYL
jgi:hypothetical protein